MSGHSTNCTSDDADGDGSPAINDTDSDNDGLTDYEELNHTMSPTTIVDQNIFKINYFDDFIFKAIGEDFKV